MSRSTFLWALAAVAGVFLVAGVTYAASRLSSQAVGLSSEPVSAGEGLTPRELEATPPTPTPRATPRKPRRPRATATPTATPTAAPETDGESDSHGDSSGQGRGRGRGRGGDEPDDD